MATVDDVEVANASFPNVRQDLNDILEAITTNFSADTEPTTTYPNQFWYETDTNLLYIRNEADDAWITLASINQTTGEWEPRTAVIQAIDSAGIALKTDDGTTRFSISDAGVVSFENYAFPSADGTAGQVLQTDGSGTLTFEDAGAGDKIEEGNSSVEVVDAGTGYVAVTVDGSETARFEDNGRLGIGTTTPGSMLTIVKTDTADLLLKSTLSTNTELKLSAIAFGTPEINVASNHGLIFKTNDTERMRIDSGGKIYAGTNTGVSNERFILAAGTSEGIRVTHTGGGTKYPVNFTLDGSGVGSISISSGGTSYNTASDYRLKENVVDMTDAIDRIKALPVKRFNFIADPDKAVDGFLAHEAQEIVPESVTGEKDQVKAIGNITDAEGVVVEEGVIEPVELEEGQTWTKTGDRPVYQGIDQSKLVPLLTGALKEAIVKIEALEARVSALET